MQAFIPSLPEIFQALGMSANYSLRFENMESAFIANEDASLFVQLAQAYRDAGDFDRAFRILRRGIEQHPGHGPGYELLGRTLLDRGRVAEAAFCFERLLEIDASNPIAQGALDEIARRLREAPVTRATTIGAAGTTATSPTPPFSTPMAPPRPPSLSTPPQWPQNPVEPLNYPTPSWYAPPVIPPQPPPQVAETSTPVSPEAPPSAPAAPQFVDPAPPIQSVVPTAPPVVPAPEPVAAPATPPAVPAPAADARSIDDQMPWEEEPPPAVNGASSLAASLGVAPTPTSAQPAPSPEAKALEASLKEGQATHQSGESGRLGLLDPSAVAIADLLVGLVEYRDPFFRGNTSLTRLLATAVARDLHLSDDEVSAIALGAVLRDVGQFPLRSLLNRPGLELPASARKKMERHVDTALEMLAGIELPAITREVIRYHHERWDGAGYPEGRKSESIPLAARVVAVADSFSAMISARPHRLPRRVPTALEEIRAAAGSQFDPRVVDSLMRVVNATHWKGPGFSLRHHVLIVDPDETRAMVIATRLCSHGYLAEATFNGAAAQERLERSHIVALIISSDLPGDEEDRLLHQVRETARIAMIPVIITDAGVSERVPLLESGADVCLNRGSSFEELKATLEAFLRREGKLVPSSGGAKPSENGWSRLRGDIHDFPLNWLLQVLHYDSRTAAIFIVGAGDEGVIYLDRGTPRHAQTRLLSGEEAFRTMLQWKTGSFSVDPEARTENHTIRLALMSLLLDTAVEEDNARFFGQVQT